MLEPHARPDRQPHHRGQGDRQRRGRLQRARTVIADVKFLAKMNGAVGNYNAHLSAYPSHDWKPSAARSSSSSSA